MEAADLMIWQFPLWWFSMPGILKGWVDKVFAFNRVYGRGRFYDKGLYLRQARAVVADDRRQRRGRPTSRANSTGTSTASCARSSAACWSSLATTC